VNAADPAWITFKELATTLRIPYRTLRDRMRVYSATEGEVPLANGLVVPIFKQGNRWYARRGETTGVPRKSKGRKASINDQMLHDSLEDQDQ
jgi:hypothetical protein